MSLDRLQWLNHQCVVAQATSVHPDVDYQNGVGFSTIVGGDICGVGFGAEGGGGADHLVSLTI